MSKDQNNEIVTQSLQAKYAPIISAAILTMVIVGVMLYSFFIGRSMAERFCPLVDAAMEIKLEATTAHLWFEEIVSGDRFIEIEVIWEHLDQAEWYARAMLEGGENQKGKFIPLKEPALRREIEQTIDGISNFRKIAQDRWKAQSQSGIGSDVDQRFDKIFENLLISADNVQIALQRGMKGQSLRFRVLQGILIAIVVILGAFIGTVLQRHERRFTSDMLILQHKEESLHATLNSIGDAVITSDIDGNITRMNPVAEKLTGWTLEEARGKPLIEIFHIINAQTKEPALNPVKRVLESGEIVGLANHTALIAKDGTEYQIADSGAPIRDTNGNISGVVLVFQDVTEQMKTEQELFKSKKLDSIGVLAGGIAHDFNNILTGLFGNVELAKMKLPHDHEAYTYLEIANQALQRATNLTKQLLTFAKGGDPILEAVSIEQAIQDSIKFNLSGSNVRTVLNLPDNLWQIKADKGQLSQIMANLTINAKQAMPEGGALHIDAENIKNINDSAARHLSGDFVKLSIRDEGVGIYAKYIEKIFDPFFSTKQTGSGLGLATVHSIITNHNGHISVDSKPGIGTIFTVYFPAELSLYKTTDTIPLSVTEKPKSTSGHILVMDDEEILIDVSTAMLESYGYTVDSAVDGKEALEKYISADRSDNPFDIVIMDLTIPGGMGGKEAVNKLLAIYPKAKVIVASGYSTDPIMANYRDYGFKGRLVRPFQMDDLERELTRVMKI